MLFGFIISVSFSTKQNFSIKQLFNLLFLVLYLGQKGCTENDQCSMRVTEARCEQNYCVCPRNKLIHQSKCVTHCPEGLCTFLLIIQLIK